ncbi:MAG: SBBP repeat-containing protein [Promethearchaeota archaeon]
MNNKKYYILLILGILVTPFYMNFNNSKYNEIQPSKLTKLSNSSSVQWNTTWGGAENDWASGLVLDSLGNAYVAGSTASFGGTGFNMSLVKFNITGGVEWYKIWGGKRVVFGRAMASDMLGNIYVSGEISGYGAGSYDICLVKFNSTGDVEWNSTWGGINEDFGSAITLDSSGNIYVAGATLNFGAVSSDMCVVKFNSTGGVEWNNTWGGNDWDTGNAITVDSLGNSYVTGYTTNILTGDKDMSLVKFNSTGGVEWNYTWGGSNNDGGFGIILDVSGNIYISGSTEDNIVGDADICLVKFNSTGGVEWNSTWGGVNNDFGSGIIQDPLGNFYVTGTTDNFGAVNTDMCVIKFNPIGVVEWNCTWGGNAYDVGYAINLDSLGDVYVAGNTESFGVVNTDIFLVKFKLSSGGEVIPDIPNPDPIINGGEKIPGYDFFMLLGITFVISTLILWRQWRLGKKSLIN